MNYLTSFRVLLVLQMLCKGTLQLQCVIGNVSENYECKVVVQQATDVRCKYLAYPGDDLHERYYNYYYWIAVNESNSTQPNDSESRTFSLKDVRTEMLLEFCRFFVCPDDPGILDVVLDLSLDELRAMERFKSQCYDIEDCLGCSRRVPASINVKSLNITKVGEIKLQKSSFQPYPNLTVLSLTESDVYFDRDVFHGLSFLRRLTLSGDNITVLQHGLFIGLEKLAELDVSRNRLTEISRENFTPLPSMVFLSLSHNEIRTLSDDVFSSLPALKVLSLSSNQLERLPPKVFHETEHLTDVDLSGNRITEFPKELLWNLHQLEVLNLSRSGLQSLDAGIFGNSSSLKVLVLSYNELKLLPNTIFPVQFKLETLDVSHNKLHCWSAQILKNVSNLSTLLLNNNLLDSLPTDMLNATRDLKILDVSGNKLRSFDGKLVKPLRYLHVLNASRNSIRYVELGLYNSVVSRNLNFSRNEIIKLDIDWIKLSDLERVDFDWNNLASLDLPACLKYSRQATFSFRHNNISHVKMSYSGYDLRDPRTCSLLPKNILFLAGNQFDCDCSLYGFYKQVTKLPSMILYTFSDRDTWNCNRPYYLKGFGFGSLGEEMFLCPVEDCPVPCFCGVRATDNRIIVNCSGENLEAVPGSAPKNVSILYFRDNKLKNLNLREGIWQNLTEIYLENNLLENVEAMDIPEDLRMLSLSGNRLRNVSLSLRNFVSLHKDAKLRLGNNSFNCTCSLKSLKDWLLKHKRNIDDLNNVTCEVMENGESRDIALYKVPDTLLCPEELSQAVQIATIAGIVSSSVLVISGLLLLVVYYRNAETVLAFLYGTSLFHCFFREDPEEEEEKIFDAFVAYSSTDREVVMKLVEQLEGESPLFKLCIHERDWIAGEFVSENIVRSVQSSRRVVLILSEDFVSSSWFAVELRAVLLQMLQDRINRLVVVVVGKFPSLDAIENDIRQLLLRRTYLVWGERWFWEKIRYALPHKGQRERAARTKPRGRTFRLVSLVEKEVSGVLGQDT